MRDLIDRLKAIAAADGLTLFGVADLERLGGELERTGRGRGLFGELPRAFPRAIAMGVPLSGAVVDEIVGHPTVLYFHLYRQANYALDRAAFLVANELERAGYEALAVPASQIVGSSPMRGHLSHREIAHAAGLGWRGRNNLLVSPVAGSRLRLVTVLADAPLPPDFPIEHDCGVCRACVGACPAGAIHDDPLAFDLDACYQKLCEFRRLPFIGQHICGVCVKACRGPLRGRAVEQ